MFNVSALLLDEALLKYVVTDVVLFSVVALKTLIFHKVTVATYLKHGAIFNDNDSIVVKFKEVSLV